MMSAKLLMNRTTDRAWRYVRFSLSLFIVLIAGCVNFLPSVLGGEVREVRLGAVDYKQCVTDAANGIDGISASSSNWPEAHPNIELKVNFQKPIPRLVAEVQYRSSNSANISFLRVGGYQPRWVHEEIRPWIDKVADAIDKKCGVGQKQ